MKLFKNKSFVLSATAVVACLVTIKSAKALIILAPLVLYISLAALGIGMPISIDKYNSMNDRERFIYYTSVADVNTFVDFDQRGFFKDGFDVDTDMANGLMDLRLNLKDVVVNQQHQMTAAQYDAIYGTDAAPNFCAVSREFIVASFKMHYGETPADYDISKYSTCTP